MDGGGEWEEFDFGGFRFLGRISKNRRPGRLSITPRGSGPSDVLQGVDTRTTPALAGGFFRDGFRTKRSRSSPFQSRWLIQNVASRPCKPDAGSCLRRHRPEQGRSWLEGTEYGARRVYALGLARPRPVIRERSQGSVLE